MKPFSRLQSLSARPAAQPATRFCWVAALAAAVFLLSLREVTDLDLFYHLANGRSILDAGAIPAENLFTYPRTALPFYPNPAWLFGVLALLVYQGFGLAGVILAKTALLLVLFALLLRLLREEGLGVRAAAAVLVWVALATAFRFTERPHLFSYLFFALFIYLVQRHRRGARTPLVLLPLAMLLWINLHAGFVFGLLYLALVLAADGLQQLLGGRLAWLATTVPPWRQWRTLGGYTAATAAASLLGPTALTNYRFLIQSVGVRSEFPISEYAPPLLREVPWFFAGLAVMALLLVLRPRRQELARLLPAVLFGVLACTAIRFVPLAVLAALPWLATRLRGSGAVVPEGLRQAGPWRGMLLDGALPLALALLVALAPSVASRFGFGVERSSDFRPALHFLQTADLRGKLYNSMSLGGVGMFFLYPQYRLFQTSFFQVEREVITEAYRAAQNPEAWQALLAKYRVDIAFVDTTREPHSPLYYPAQEWALVYFDDISAVFVRRQGMNPEAVRQYEFRVAHPARFFGDAGAAAGVDLPRLSEGISELRRALAWNPDSYVAHLMLGYYLTNLPGGNKEAVEHFTRATVLNPDSATAHFQLGILLREENQPAAAVASLRAAARLAPEEAAVFNELGVALERQGDLAAAIEAFDRALEMAPGYEEARQNRDLARRQLSGQGARR